MLLRYIGDATVSIDDDAAYYRGGRYHYPTVVRVKGRIVWACTIGAGATIQPFPGHVQRDTFDSVASAAISFGCDAECAREEGYPEAPDKLESASACCDDAGSHHVRRRRHAPVFVCGQCYRQLVYRHPCYLHPDAGVDRLG